MDLGGWIASKRKDAGLSQRTFAKALGLSPSAVAQWELNDTTPQPGRFLDICDVLKVPAEEFFGQGALYPGQLVELTEELILLEVWRKLRPGERTFYLDLLRRTVRLGDAEAPEPARKRV